MSNFRADRTTSSSSSDGDRTTVSGLTRAEVDARIRALVNALALGANTERWPENRLDEALARDTEVLADIANFLNQAQIQALIDASVSTSQSGRIHDRGVWSAATAYSTVESVRHSGAYYLAIQNSPANSGSVTEPGVGSAWQTYWYRIGYEQGPPNAFVNVSIENRVLTFGRESGNNPLNVTLPEGNNVTVPPTIAAFNPVLLTDRTYTWDGGVQQTLDVLTGTAGSAHLVSPDNGFLLISVHGFGHFEGNTTWRLSEDLRISTASDPLHVRPTGSSGFTPSDIYTNNDNEIIFHPGISEIPSSNDRITIWHVPEPASDSAAHGLPRVERIEFDALANAASDVEATPVSANPISVLSGSGDAQILSGVNGNDFSIAAGVYTIFLDVVLTTDQTNANPHFDIRRASDNVILFNSTSPTIRGTGAHRAGIIMVALFTSDTVVNVFIERENRRMSFPANWGLDFIRISGIDAPAVRPAITRFDVDGESSPAAGSIAGQVYRYGVAISQPAHVSLARIVGFPGSALSPPAVTVLATLSEYHAASGSVSIPAGVSLTAGQAYTLRLEVYETGQIVGTDTPAAYHDYRITAHAADGAVHFGRVLASEDATNIVFADDDIASAGSVTRTWVAQIPDDGNSYRLYWAVPTAEPQPSHWSTGGVSINIAVEAAVDHTIGGVAYKIYLFASVSAVDHLYDGTSIEVTA